jgi:hypothetical protein
MSPLQKEIEQQITAIREEISSLSSETTYELDSSDLRMELEELVECDEIVRSHIDEIYMDEDLFSEINDGSFTTLLSMFEDILSNECSSFSVDYLSYSLLQIGEPRLALWVDNLVKGDPQDLDPQSLHVYKFSRLGFLADCHRALGNRVEEEKTLLEAYALFEEAYLRKADGSRIAGYLADVYRHNGNTDASVLWQKRSDSLMILKVDEMFRNRRKKRQ